MKFNGVVALAIALFMFVSCSDDDPSGGDVTQVTDETTGGTDDGDTSSTDGSDVEVTTAGDDGDTGDTGDVEQDEPGACCLSTTCQVLRAEECKAAGGSFHDPGSTCADVECAAGPCCEEGRGQRLLTCRGAAGPPERGTGRRRCPLAAGSARTRESGGKPSEKGPA